MNGFLQSLRNLGPVRLAMLGATALGTLLVFVYITAQFSGEKMSVLFSDLSASDGGAIVDRLEQMNVPYKASADGTRISVADSQLGRVRLLLADEGLPAGGGVGYEIFNQPEGFGTTTFLQNINQQRAMEGELARTIRTMSQIKNARVQLVLPRRELFSREANQARASVFIETKGGTVDREQIRAIQHLVSAAVPQLEPSRVAIIDSRGNLLASGLGQNSVSEAQSTAEEQRLAIEQRLAQRVEEILSSTVGYGKVRAQVTADLDMETVTTQSESYDPETQVARSTQSVSEDKEETSPDAAGNGDVTVAANLPGGAANPATPAATGAAASPTSKSSRTEETTNFEISKTTQSQTRLPGAVKRLSVAVLVDGTYKTEGEGKEEKQVYVPRTQEELDKFAALVRSAVGYDADRGDTVEVQNLQFASEDLVGEEGGSFLGVYQDRLMRIVEIGITALIGLVVLLPIILLVVRPLINSLGTLRASAAEEETKLLSGLGATPQLAGPSSSALAADMAAEAEAAAESMIDISQVDGRVKASSLKKMGEIIDKHPEEAVAIVRQWIYAEN